MSDKIGVLVMSYGTPADMDQVEAYYTHIRRGRPPAQAQLDDLVQRYQAIGGTFPLRANTDQQVEALQEELNRRAGTTRFVCYQGLRHAEPFIEDGIAQMAQDGITEAIAIVLAPHYSQMSVGGYHARAVEEAAKHGINIQTVHSYHLHPDWLDAWTARVIEACDTMLQQNQADPLVIFSAHSLPARILQTDDPYVDQLMESARQIAAKAGIERWMFAWQSAGQTGEPWLGPDILQVFDTLVKEGSAASVLVCPIGFVSDHLEVLYDLDIEATQESARLGLGFARPRMLNSDPAFISVLADEVWAKAVNN